MVVEIMGGRDRQVCSVQLVRDPCSPRDGERAPRFGGVTGCSWCSVGSVVLFSVGDVFCHVQYPIHPFTPPSFPSQPLISTRLTGTSID